MFENQLRFKEDIDAQIEVEKYKEKFPKIYEKWKRNEITVERALRQIKGWLQIEKREEKQTVLKKENLEINNKYKVIYADPPWDYGVNNRTGFGGDASTHYTTMKLEEICTLPVKEISEKNSILFIWVTSPFLFKSKQVVDAWGFTYKASFVWDKVKHNMGWYNSVRHEFLLVCTRGSCTPEVKKLFDSVQSIERSKTHSSKPEKFYEIIETLYPSASKIELFARNSRKGWSVWGNESNNE